MNKDKKNIMVNLYDAFGDQSKDIVLDWGLSIYIEFNGSKILFDGGSSAIVLEKNAKTLGVDLSKVDYAILSHNHNDHSTGLDYLLEVNPDINLYLPNDYDLGAGECSKPDIKRGFRYQKGRTTFVEKTIELQEGVFLVCTSSKLTGKFYAYPPHEEAPKLIELPEISLLLLDKEKGKSTLFAGCSHTGVEKIAEASYIALNKEPVKMIVGGFHQLSYEEDFIKNVIHRLDEVGLEEVAPAHCTGDMAMKILKNHCGEKFHHFGVGSKVSF